MSESTALHRAAAEDRRALCAVLTVSDTRTPETDTGGRKILDGLAAAGHATADYGIVRDEPREIAARLDAWLARPEIQVIVTTGGTGISSRDTTIEVVAARLDRVLDGFGELFRMLSWDQVGSAAMLSRAIAGLKGETLIFALPGSPAAVELALDRLILPELPHLLFERAR